jgi:hypothetical protein
VAKGLTLDIGMNTREVVRGAGDVETALEGVSDALDAAARDGDEAAEKLERSFSEAQRDISRSSRRMGDDVSDNSRRGFNNAREGIREVRGEAIQNLSEVASSFDGSVQGIADGFQGLAGGAAAGLIALGGPAAGAGAALAAVGLIGGAVMTGLTEDAEKNKEAIGRWAQSYIDAGSTILGAAQITAGALAIATDPERYAEAERNAADWGVTVGTAMRAMAGDTTALAAAQTNLNERTAEAARLLAIQEEQVDANAGAAYDLDDATKRGAYSLAQLNAQMATGQGIARNTSDALKGIVQNAGTAAEEVDELGNRLYTLPDGAQVLIRADTGLATQDLTAFKDDLDGIAEQVDTKLVVTADTSQAEGQLAKLSKKTLKVTVSLVNRYGREIV